jgi:hypothetical protein
MGRQRELASYSSGTALDPQTPNQHPTSLDEFCDGTQGDIFHSEPREQEQVLGIRSAIAAAAAKSLAKLKVNKMNACQSTNSS